MDLSKILCIIPARGGSKGIPHKNMRMLGGIPLVAHSILHARQAGFAVENIVISSDDDKILECASYGAIPLKRPEDISGDNSSTELALLHACRNSKKDIQHILLLQPTSPIRFPDSVKGFLEFYLCNNYDSAVAATEFHNFFWYLEDKWKSTYTPNKRPMRQSMEFKDNCFFENGNMYITSVDTLNGEKCRIGGKVGVYPISELEGMQIDSPRDLYLFENIFEGTIINMTGVENGSNNNQLPHSCGGS